jgi:hypothetical protein
MTKPLPPKKPPPDGGMLRLFTLVDSQGRAVRDAQGNILYFTDKKTAKAKRQDGQHVGLGPDHRRHPEYADA